LYFSRTLILIVPDKATALDVPLRYVAEWDSFLFVSSLYDTRTAIAINGRSAHCYADRVHIHPHSLLRLESAVDVNVDIAVNWIRSWSAAWDLKQKRWQCDGGNTEIRSEALQRMQRKRGCISRPAPVTSHCLLWQVSESCKLSVP
jgi:hypothetical protein